MTRADLAPILLVGVVLLAIWVGSLIWRVARAGRRT